MYVRVRTYVCLIVRLCVCVCARACACVYVCVCVCPRLPKHVFQILQFLKNHLYGTNISSRIAQVPIDLLDLDLYIQFQTFGIKVYLQIFRKW